MTGGSSTGPILGARIVGPGKLILASEELAEPTVDRPRVKVNAVGLCGSDAHWFEEGSIGDATITGSLILGHEFSGTVETGPWAGRRVAVDPAIPCLNCSACLDDQPHLCLDGQFAGHGRTDGALRTHLTWPADLLEPLSDEISDAAGALLEPLGVALHAVDLAKNRLTVPSGGWKTAGVFGCGPIGLLVIAVLRATGTANIVATDPLPHRLAAAATMGATSTFLANGNEVEQVLGATDGMGVDVAFVASGEPAATEAAIAAVRPAGRIVLLGISSRDRTSFAASVARRKELSMVVCRRMRPGDLERAARLAVSHSIPLESMISLRLPLVEIDRAFRYLVERSGLKVIVEP